MWWVNELISLVESMQLINMSYILIILMNKNVPNSLAIALEWVLTNWQPLTKAHSSSFWMFSWIAFPRVLLHWKCGPILPSSRQERQEEVLCGLSRSVPQNFILSTPVGFLQQWRNFPILIRSIPWALDYQLRLSLSLSLSHTHTQNPTDLIQCQTLLIISMIPEGKAKRRNI